MAAWRPALTAYLPHSADRTRPSPTARASFSRRTIRCASFAARGGLRGKRSAAMPNERLLRGRLQLDRQSLKVYARHAPRPKQ
jgi:hypothetical protein